MSIGENFDLTDHDNFDETLLIKMQFSERCIAELVTVGAFFGGFPPPTC